MPKTGTGLQNITCDRCGKPMTRWLSQVKAKNYCSNKCRVTPVEERFWPKVDRSKGEDACWPWTASFNNDGYGNFPWNGEYRAPRVAWVLTKGQIPEGLSVLHDPIKCNNRACCNPKHLYLGTQFQNVQDMIKIGMKASTAGEEHPNSLLNDDAIKEIRLKYNRVDAEILADKFKVTVGTVRDVAKGRSWKSVTPKNYWDAQGIKRKTRKDNISNLH